MACGKERTSLTSGRVVEKRMVAPSRGPVPKLGGPGRPAPGEARDIRRRGRCEDVDPDGVASYTSAMTRSDLAPELAEIVRRLAVAFGPARIILFGSRARGDARPDSDYDILVITATDEPLLRRMALANHALRGLTAPVDVIVCTPEEVERFAMWRSHTVATALREGRELHAA